MSMMIPGGAISTVPGNVEFADWLWPSGNGGCDCRAGSPIALQHALDFNLGAGGAACGKNYVESPGDLNNVFFTTGGSTAVDTALRFAHFYNNLRGRPEKKHIIARQKWTSRIDIHVCQCFRQGTRQELPRHRCQQRTFRRQCESLYPA